MGIGGSFPGGKLTTHLQLVLRSRNCGSVHPLPIRLHGVVLDQLSTGTTLPLPVETASKDNTFFYDSFKTCKRILWHKTGDTFG
jgi:hypothetical protein